MTAGSPLAEVFLIDHAFALVDRSVGDLESAVEPGIYKVKVRLGGATAERLIVLRGDQSIDLSADLPIASPAPIVGASRMHEDHMSAARSESSHVVSTDGSGAQIFFMARRWTAAGDPPQEPASPPEVSLHRPDGNMIVELDRRRMSGDFALGTTAEVDPGTYFLRCRDGSGVIAEQSVHAVAGWQTQVFLLEVEEGAQTARPRASVLMGRDGFRPDGDALRTVEEARSALAGERNIASAQLNTTVFESFEDPMLGLFGAHLMLLARDTEREAHAVRSRKPSAERPRAPVRFEQSLFDHVVETLGLLLGADHPDVVALATQASDQELAELSPLKAPPMLWRSWALLIDASNDAPALVPLAVWRRTLTLLPRRPFLAWSPEERSPGSAQKWQQEAVRALAVEEEGLGEQPSQIRRRLTRQLLAPRAAIDELAPGGPL